MLYTHHNSSYGSLWSNMLHCLLSTQTHFILFLTFPLFWPCYLACRILVPLPGIKPSAVKVQIPNHWTTREVTRTPACLKSLKVDCPLAPISCLIWHRCGAGHRSPAVCLWVCSASCGLQPMLRGWQRCLLLFFSHSVVSDSFRPHDCSPPGFSVHGFSQARILEWVAIPFSRGFSQPRD